jgi:hypothetical protein
VGYREARTLERFRNGCGICYKEQGIDLEDSKIEVQLLESNSSFESEVEGKTRYYFP